MAEEIKAGSYEVADRVTPQRLLDKIVRGEFCPGGDPFYRGLDLAPGPAACSTSIRLVKHDTVAMSDTEILQQVRSSGKIARRLDISRYLLILRRYQRPDPAAAGIPEDAIGADAALGTAGTKLPLRNAYEALILASIVEKETGRNDEREMVAAVFVNRLKRGMRLQTDPSIIYGMGEKFDGNLRRRDLVDRGIYNTYTRAGLPPTPIAMPGDASIRATLNPAQSPGALLRCRGATEATSFPRH